MKGSLPESMTKRLSVPEPFGHQEDESHVSLSDVELTEWFLIGRQTGSWVCFPIVLDQAMS